MSSQPSRYEATMDRWCGKVAIVTGASRGIGSSITRALAQQGMHVVACARNLKALKDLQASLSTAKGKVHPIECDLTDEKQILRVFEWTEKNLRGADVLVNNAGLLVPGKITESTTESFRKIMDVNVIAVAICTREAVRSMKKRNVSGHIININSVAGQYPETITIPLNLYPASKCALTAMCHAVRCEMAAEKLDIKVTSISPGAVKTDMITSAGIPEGFLKALPTLEDKDIANAVVYALSTPPGVHVAELTIKPDELLQMNQINQ